MVKNLLLWLVIATVLLTVFNNFSVQSKKEVLDYSSFIQEVQNDRVRRRSVNVGTESLSGHVGQLLKLVVSRPSQVTAVPRPSISHIVDSNRSFLAVVDSDSPLHYFALADIWIRAGVCASWAATGT